MRLTYEDGGRGVGRRGGGTGREWREGKGRRKGGSEGGTERREEGGDEEERGQEPKGENRGRGRSLTSQHCNSFNYLCVKKTKKHRVLQPFSEPEIGRAHV